MAIVQAFCNSCKAEILEGIHNFSNPGGHTFKVALYTASANLDATTTAYSATNEVSSTNYTAGGATLASVTPALVSGVAVITFTNVTWTSVTFSALGAVIYNTSAANRAICVLNFGTVQTAASQNFTIQWPTADNVNGILRIA
jgi:hypothetical protein